MRRGTRPTFRSRSRRHHLVIHDLSAEIAILLNLRVGRRRGVILATGSDADRCWRGSPKSLVRVVGDTIFRDGDGRLRPEAEEYLASVEERWLEAERSYEASPLYFLDDYHAPAPPRFGPPLPSTDLLIHDRI